MSPSANSAPTVLKHLSTKKQDLKINSTTIDHSADDKSPIAQEIVLTGDDLVVEYVQRLCHTLRELTYINLPQIVIDRIETFANYKVWSKPLSLIPSAK